MLRKLEKCCLVTGVMGILLMGMPFNISASEEAAVQENSLESGNEVDHSQEGQLSKPKSLEGLEAISGEDQPIILTDIIQSWAVQLYQPMKCVPYITARVVLIRLKN